MAFERYNDGSNNPPRLRVEHSLWSMIQLPMNAEVEWTIDEKFRRAKEAGFEAIECRPLPENEAEIVAALEKYELKSVIAVKAFELEDVHETVTMAKRLGSDFIWMQPGSAFTPLEKAVELASDGRKICNDAGYAMFVEIHRNNFTETLPQTLQLIERVPDIRMTADLSHFVVINQFYGWPEERAIERYAPILTRTSHIHGRVSNGQQVQVDVGDGSGETPQFFVRMWADAMRHWLKGAQPGDVLPFASELGPPRYAITLPDGREFSDRWEQSLVMKKLAEQAWAEATATVEA